MTVVFDASAGAALASPEDDPSHVVESALMNEVCYMTPAAVVAMYVIVHDKISKDAAEYWLGFVLSGRDIRLDTSADRELLESAGEATLIASNLVSTGCSAALAGRLRVQLITNLPEAAQLEEKGICSIRRFGAKGDFNAS